jgi:outer membrane protein assembly factor BamB
MKLAITLLSSLILLPSAFLSAADWPQFRGPNASAVSTEATVPGPKVNIAWNVDLPGRGLSRPIAAGDKFYHLLQLSICDETGTAILAKK